MVLNITIISIDALKALGRECNINPLAPKSGIDGHPESPQVSHSWSANTAQHLNSLYVVASSD